MLENKNENIHSSFLYAESFHICYGFFHLQGKQGRHMITSALSISVNEALGEAIFLERWELNWCLDSDGLSM